MEKYFSHQFSGEAEFHNLLIKTDSFKNKGSCRAEFLKKAKEKKKKHLLTAVGQYARRN